MSHLKEFVHDVRVVLSSIRGNAELVEMISDDEEIKSHVSRIIRGVDFLENLMSSFERVMEGNVSLEVVDPCSIVEEVLETLKAEFEILERDFTFRCDGKRVRVDRILLYRILLNLIGNSLRHGSGTVRIRVFEGNITIEDDGEWNSRKKGLGLSIVEKLVEMMGGSFEIVDKNDGKSVKVRLEVVR